MTTISTNGNISWSVSDTFNIIVEAEESFTTGDTLTFEVASNEESTVLVSQIFQLSDGKFTIELTSAQRAKMPIGTYIYRMILNHADGTIVTEESGVLYAKWGA